MSAERASSPLASGQAAGERFDAVTHEALPERWVTRVHLLRHGEIHDMGTRALWGQLDAPLSLEGRRQTRELARWMSDCHARPDLIASSDLTRCAELGRELARRAGAELVLAPELREQHLGEWQGHSWEAITRGDLERVRAYWSDYARVAPPGGESLLAVQARALGWWQARELELRERRVWLVTHVGVIRALLAHWLATPLDEALRCAPATGSHSEVLLSEGGAVLNALGERPWLAARREGAALSSAREFASAPVAGRAEPAQYVAAPRALRLALSGSAGTGKTTLARALAARLGLPYIEEGMRARLEAGLDLHGIAPQRMAALIEELWEQQHARERECATGFVADRSSVDYAAFWLHYGLYEDEARTERFLARMRAAAESYERIALLPWGVLPLVDDRVRSTNRWLQLRYQRLLEGLLASWDVRCARLCSDGLEQRLSEALEALAAPRT